VAEPESEEKKKKKKSKKKPKKEVEGDVKSRTAVQITGVVPMPAPSQDSMSQKLQF